MVFITELPAKALGPLEDAEAHFQCQTISVSKRDRRQQDDGDHVNGRRHVGATWRPFFNPCIWVWRASVTNIYLEK